MRISELFSLFLINIGSTTVQISYKIGPHPSHKMCTLHIKTFNKSMQDFTNKLIHHNKYSSLFVIQNWDLQNSFPPVISFHEACSAHILIEGNHPTDELGVFRFAYHSNYTRRSSDFANIIYITAFNITDISPFFARLPVRLFIHRLDQEHIHKRFPQKFFCPVCLPLFLEIPIKSSIFAVTSQTFSEMSYKFTSLYLCTTGYIHKPLGMSFCLNFNWKYIPLKTSVTNCYSRIMLWESFGAHLNFTARYTDCRIFRHTPYPFQGLATPMLSSAQILNFVNTSTDLISSAELLNSIAFIQESSEGLLYCENHNVMKSISPRAWITPFNIWVWIVFALAIVSLGVQQALTPYSSSSWANRIFNVIKIVLRQEEEVGFKCGLLLMSSLACFQLSTLYENELVAKLIIPDPPPKAFANIKELVDKGYSILLNSRLHHMQGFLKSRYKYDLKKYKLLDKVDKLIKNGDSWGDDHLGKFVKRLDLVATLDLHSDSGSKEPFWLTILRTISPSGRWCNKIQETLNRLPHYDVFLFHKRQQMLDLFRRFMESGLYNFWDEMFEHGRNFKIISFRNEYAKDYDKSVVVHITLWNIVPLFILCGSLIFGSGMVLGLELFVGRRKLAFVHEFH